MHAYIHTYVLYLVLAQTHTHIKSFLTATCNRFVLFLCCCVSMVLAVEFGLFCFLATAAFHCEASFVCCMNKNQQNGQTPEAWSR